MQLFGITTNFINKYHCVFQDSSTSVSEAHGCSFWRQAWDCFSPKQAQLLSGVLTAISHV